LNDATGSHSFTAGYRAKAIHDGCFVWGDETTADVTSRDVNQFVVRASGGTIFYSDAAMSTGVTLNPGAGAWATLSDRNLKENICPVDDEEILALLSRLDISRWNYKSQDESIQHIGPMAQDFVRLFSVGDDDRTISTIDPDGVALAAIKALIEQNRKQQQQIDALIEMLSER
jgi:hypothetical protein